ncbi:MAG: cytochrome P450 [Deinococcaceae bacterium]
MFLHGCRKYPGQVLRLGNAYVVSDPEHVQEVLIDKAEHFGKSGGMWKALKPLLGEGLITAEGESWQKQRRLMQPLFTRAAIGEHVPNLRALVENECERILQGPNTIDIAAEMRSLSQKILLHTIFGTSQMKATAALHTALSALNLRLFLYFLPNSWIPKAREFMQAISEIDQTIAELDTSLLADSGLSPKELRDQLVTLYVAGSDTVATDLVFPTIRT